MGDKMRRPEHDLLQHRLPKRGSACWVVRTALKAQFFCGLNPFFIRSMVRTESHRRRHGLRRLNPFFIRSMVRTWPAIHAGRSVRLNPFFIRSMVRTARVFFLLSRQWVAEGVDNFLTHEKVFSQNLARRSRPPAGAAQATGRTASGSSRSHSRRWA